MYSHSKSHFPTFPSSPQLLAFDPPILSFFHFYYFLLCILFHSKCQRHKPLSRTHLPLTARFWRFSDFRKPFIYIYVYNIIYIFYIYIYIFFFFPVINFFNLFLSLTVNTTRAPKDRSPSPTTPSSPSQLLAFDDLAISEPNTPRENGEGENVVILENLASVRKYKLHPSLLSDAAVRVSLFNQDIGVEGVREVSPPASPPLPPLLLLPSPIFLFFSTLLLPFPFCLSSSLLFSSPPFTSLLPFPLPPLLPAIKNFIQVTELLWVCRGPLLLDLGRYFFLLKKYLHYYFITL